MPGGDRTGPAGMGPMTGRGMGFCAGYPNPGFANPMPGRGAWGRGAWGRGGGRGGWGRRNWFYATGLTGRQRAGYGYPPMAAPYVPSVSPEQEVEMLKGQAENLEGALADVKKRLEELETAGKES